MKELFAHRHTRDPKPLPDLLPRCDEENSADPEIGPPSAEEPDSDHRSVARNYIRGSSLLLFGRIISLSLNFCAQVLVIRYLSKTEYGAFAFGLAVASLGTSTAVLGLDKAIRRFVPIFQQRRDYDKMYGATLLMLTTVVVMGFSLVLLTFGLHGLIGHRLISSSLSRAMMLILILLVPFEALDCILVSMFAIFANPRAIFVRRYLLAPGLKLAVVVAVVATGSSVYWMAMGHVGAAFLGLTVCGVLLLKVLGKNGGFDHFRRSSIKLPMREVFGFSVPLLSSDLVFVLRGTMVVALLEYFHGSAEVATFRAVRPLAHLSLIVPQTFSLLFLPMAARMFAHGDREGINQVYWGSASWLAILSFPVFAVTFATSQHLPALLFGERYADSGIILAFLAMGFYVHAAFGFNALVLKAYGKVRYLVAVDLLTASVALGIQLWLIPHYGAIGGAIGACATLLLHSILNQVALWHATDVRLFPRRCFVLCTTTIAASLALFPAQLAALPMYLALLLAISVSLFVWWINREALDVEETFPELMRFALVRRFLAAPHKTS